MNTTTKATLIPGATWYNVGDFWRLYKGPPADSAPIMAIQRMYGTPGYMVVCYGSFPDFGVVESLTDAMRIAETMVLTGAA